MTMDSCAQVRQPRIAEEWRKEGEKKSRGEGNEMSGREREKKKKECRVWRWLERDGKEGKNLSTGGEGGFEVLSFIAWGGGGRKVRIGRSRRAW